MDNQTTKNKKSNQITETIGSVTLNIIEHLTK